MDTLEHQWTGRDVADPAVVAELADAISAIGTRKSIEAVVEIGRLLFDRCHSGLRSRVGRSATIDALAAAPGATLKRAGLYRSVQIYLQWEEMPPDVRDALGPTQHAALLVLPADHTEKIPLAREAAMVQMPTRELAARVRELAGAAPAPTPPPAPVSAPVRKRGLPSLTQARQSLQPWAAAARAGRKPSKKEAETVLDEIGQVRAILAQLEVWADESLRA